MKNSKKMSPEEVLSYVLGMQTLKIKEALRDGAALGAKMALELEKDLDGNKAELANLLESMEKLDTGEISVIEANATSREAGKKLSVLKSKLRLANANSSISKTLKID